MDDKLAQANQVIRDARNALLTGERQLAFNRLDQYLRTGDTATTDCDCGMPAGGHLFGCPAITADNETSRPYKNLPFCEHGISVGICRQCHPKEPPAASESAHRHAYLHNADDSVGVCECGAAFKVCPSCGTDLDATGEYDFATFSKSVRDAVSETAAWPLPAPEDYMPKNAPPGPPVTVTFDGYRGAPIVRPAVSAASETAPPAETVTHTRAEQSSVPFTIALDHQNTLYHVMVALHLNVEQVCLRVQRQGDYVTLQWLPMQYRTADSADASLAGTTCQRHGTKGCTHPLCTGYED